MKTILKIIVITVGLSIFQGCDNFVNVDMPSSQLTGESVFQDRVTANAAMSDIYSKLRDDSVLTGHTTGTTVNFGLYADELDYFGTPNEGLSLVYSNSLLSTGGTAQQMWNTGYHIIYCSNAVVEGCNASTGLNQQDKDLFSGEALFVRAVLHLYLLNIYGDIPYIATTDYEANRQVVRMQPEMVYEHVVADLERAITLLPEDNPDPQRLRPGKSAAYAMLARAYLYSGNWAGASDAASAVINNSALILVPDLGQVFLKESSETIWQFSPRLEGNNADEASAFYFETGPPPSIALAEGLVNSFENGDQRKSVWIRSVTDGTATWYHPYKYKQNTNSGVSVEYSIVLRLAEQYLIRAEARARQGDLIGAIEDLNIIRNRAGLPGTAAANANDLISAVLQEREFELFTEYGHRFFDLKRMGLLDEVLPSLKPGWDANDKLWPIPESELLVNPNLQQNPGY